VADIVASEGIVLAVREVLVLVILVVFLAWVALRLVRESHR
jgi:hypothetical protein